MDNLLPAVIELDIRRNKLLFKGNTSSWLSQKTAYDLNTHYTNGLSKYVEKIRFEVISDISECEKIWNYFSPKETLFDLWEFRMFFHEVYGRRPYFLTIKKNDKMLACLPLAYEEAEKAYAWFGSSWQEDCRFFAVDPFYVPILLFFSPKPLHLYGICSEDKGKLPEFINTKEEEGNYFLNLETKTSINDYFIFLNKKKRYNLKRDYKYIKSFGPVMIEDEFEHYDKMVQITNQRFHKRGLETDFDTDPYMERIFKNIVSKSKKDFKVKMLRAEIEGKIAGIDIIAEYNNLYYPLRGGNDTTNFPGIGNFLNIYEITEAIEKNMKEINFLQYDYGWKGSCLQKRPRFKYLAKE